MRNFNFKRLIHTIFHNNLTRNNYFSRITDITAMINMIFWWETKQRLQKIPPEKRLVQLTLVKGHYVLY